MFFLGTQRAQSFTDHVTGLALENVIAVCISDATADALSRLFSMKSALPTQPNQDALLDCLSYRLE